MNGNIGIEPIQIEHIQAYVDGQLDAAQSAQVEAAIAADPALAALCDRERRLRTQLREAFDPILQEPLPARFEALLRGAPSTASVADTQAPDNVVAMPAPGRASAAAPAAVRSAPWRRSRPVYALAASIALLALSWGWWAQDGGPVSMKDDALVARGALSRGLDRSLSSAPDATEHVRIGLTFRDRDGHVCRSFAMSDDGAFSGLACREGAQWRVHMLDAGDAGGQGDLRQASVQIAPAVMAAIDGRISGDVFDADQEREARAAGWR